jgi:hypothetical protein
LITEDRLHTMKPLVVQMKRGRVLPVETKSKRKTSLPCNIETPQENIGKNVTFKNTPTEFIYTPEIEESLSLQLQISDTLAPIFSPSTEPSVPTASIQLEKPYWSGSYSTLLGKNFAPRDILARKQHFPSFWPQHGHKVVGHFSDVDVRSAMKDLQPSKRTETWKFYPSHK